MSWSERSGQPSCTWLELREPRASSPVVRHGWACGGGRGVSAARKAATACSTAGLLRSSRLTSSFGFGYRIQIATKPILYWFRYSISTNKMNISAQSKIYKPSSLRPYVTESARRDMRRDMRREHHHLDLLQLDHHQILMRLAYRPIEKGTIVLFILIDTSFAGRFERPRKQE